jgi:hypothetical protein
VQAKKKAKLGKKAGLAAGVKSTIKQVKEGNDSEGMVQYGGPALDDDVGEAAGTRERRERQARAETGKSHITRLPSTLISLQSIIRIEAPAKRITQKEQRGDGTRRWKLTYIPGPASNSDIFANKLWPNIRQNLGQAIPWDAAMNEQVQDQLDHFYGKGKMDAEAEVFRGFPTMPISTILSMQQILTMYLGNLLKFATTSPSRSATQPPGRHRNTRSTSVIPV